MNKRCCVILGLFALVMHLAPEPVLAYRPFTTEDAGVAGKGIAQMEISWDYLKWGNNDRENVFLLAPIFGVSEKLELSAEIPYIFHNPEDGDRERGIGDINLVGKYLLFEEKDSRPAFALKGVVKTKSGDEEKGLGSGNLDYSVVAALSKGWGELTLHAMVGYTFVGQNDDENLRNIYLYGFAADYGLWKNVHLVAEIAGSRHPDRSESSEMVSGLIGFTYMIFEKMTFDVGYRRGFNDTVPKWSTTMGVSLSF